MFTLLSLCDTIPMLSTITQGETMRKLTETQKGDIIKAFTEDLTPVIALAKEYGRKRQSIWKMLKKAGVNTSKGLGNTRFEVSCDYCQKTLIRTRARIRNQVRNFCGHDCYYGFIQHNHGIGAYKQNRHGQRIARFKVGQVFDLQKGNVIHHIDRNCFNNRWDNLMVFANNGDHIRFHRLGPEYVKPIWIGNMEMETIEIGHYSDKYTD